MLNTPIPQIILAYEGKMDFAVKTNPFGAPKKVPPSKAQEREGKIKRQRSRLALMKVEARQKQRGRECQKPQNDC